MEFSRPATGVGSLSLLQGIFPTQGKNPGLLHCSVPRVGVHTIFSSDNSPFTDKHGDEEIRSTRDILKHLYLGYFFSSESSGLGNEVQVFPYHSSTYGLNYFLKLSAYIYIYVYTHT